MHIQFELNQLLGDILSSDGLYVDLLDCNEYTIWYLARQVGIQGYLPVVNTKSFISDKEFWKSSTLKKDNLANLEHVKKNLHQYYSVDVIPYVARTQSIHDFIRLGIKNNRFVHVLYDHYYNNLVPGTRVHDFHGHPITGYDDRRQIYVSLADGFNEVRYQDMGNMSANNMGAEHALLYFYLSGDVGTYSMNNRSDTLEDILDDSRNMAVQWELEIEEFKGYIQYLETLTLDNVEQSIMFSLEQRTRFNSILEGIHGNFVFKLRLLQSFLKIETHSLEQAFLHNRKKSIMIANMFRKLSLKLEADPHCFAASIKTISDKATQIFLDESYDLLRRYKKLI